jgi:hypothetical protein
MYQLEVKPGHMWENRDREDSRGSRISAEHFFRSAPPRHPTQRRSTHDVAHTSHNPSIKLHTKRHTVALALTVPIAPDATAPAIEGPNPISAHKPATTTTETTTMGQPYTTGAHDATNTATVTPDNHLRKGDNTPPRDFGEGRPKCTTS